MRTAIDRQVIKNNLSTMIMRLEDKIKGEDDPRVSTHEKLSDALLGYYELEAQFEHRGGKIFLLKKEIKEKDAEIERLKSENYKLKKMERFNR